ncbi:MAG: two-component sensor histidine kinase [Sphingobacteriaceae bacterium]|nr:two-component sensor histidine kinase [Sphingobacteriaceae bacterium]
MQIRSRLTLQFVVIVALIQLLASLAIYFVSASYRESRFYEQLKASAMNRTVLMMEVEGLEPERLQELRALGAAELIGEQIFIYNYKNELLYCSSDTGLQISEAMLDEVRLNQERRFEQGPYELAGLMFADRYNRLVVFCAARDEAGFMQLQYLRRVLIAVFLMSLLAVLLLAWVYAGQALRPISNIMQKVSKITFVNLHERLEDRGSQDELSQLAATFNSMLDRIESSLAMQRNFVANASHELRTPLTAMQGQLEVLLLKKRDLNAYKDGVQSVLEDIRRLTHISNRLLMLAQADSAYTARLFRPVSLVDVLWQSQAAIQARNATALVHITIDEVIENAEALQVLGNEQLLITVFQNLLDNGVKYSPKHEVFADLRLREGGIEVKVRDYGIGIPPAELEQVFQPFYRSSNAQEITGHGIGLSLVERIVRLHGGEVHVQSVVRKGTTFTVFLRAA